ncbi:hypothetical protein BDP27DRAFT_1376099 [Rhodocollybia butyracea]|uniref:Uncharacterized protein n=1 Tax=Rhodocollybia butyracea TaxID=206335 RepID=A0A9P5P1L4_9AGAR|nr:hypothetical protein BDP27DRAFT_1376099 [Rhodocollybia butyracea]
MRRWNALKLLLTRGHAAATQLLVVLQYQVTRVTVDWNDSGIPSTRKGHDCCWILNIGCIGGMEVHYLSIQDPQSLFGYGKRNGWEGPNIGSHNSSPVAVIFKVNSGDKTQLSIWNSQRRVVLRCAEKEQEWWLESKRLKVSVQWKEKLHCARHMPHTVYLGTVGPGLKMNPLYNKSNREMPTHGALC